MKNIIEYTRNLGSGLKSLFPIRLSAKFVFIIMGILSTIWFLIRVIPKPQRAGYPCMKAAAPIMSGFVIYLVTLGGSVLFFKRFFSKLKQARYWSALISFVICLVLLVAFNLNDIKVIYAKTVGITAAILPDGANNPMGVAQGIFPGRVIWARNQSATKASCPNTSNTDCFFMESNNNQDTINKMADNSIKKLTGGNTVKDSWDALFKYFNNKKTGTTTGYTTGQTIFIKVNNGQAGWDIDPSTLEEPDGALPIAETTPATVLAFIRQLVDSCAIPQNKIYLGEPMTHIYQHLYTVINDKYPNVKILDKDDFTSLGRTTSAGWTNEVIFYSDKGDVMQDAVSDAIMKEMYNADYLINIAAMKAHARNGVSLCAKLHFGSHWSHGNYGYGSFYLHPGLLSTTDNDVFDRTDYHMYRVLVDLMGHKKLGGNTVLFVIDGLWGGTEGTENGVKWKTFNNSWPNSLFLSQDIVAIESVGLDFLRAEATVNSQFQNRPLVQAVDDYIHQAADPANWPTGISYDPNNSGTPITSLGVHEHWNNSTDRQYTRDLYTNGTGIDLVSIPDNLVKHDNGTMGINSLQASNLFKSFPNPFRTEVSISYSLPGDSKVSISICNISGQVITKLIDNKQMAGNHIQNWVPSASLQKGTYLAMICVNNSLVKCLKLNYN